MFSVVFNTLLQDVEKQTTKEINDSIAQARLLNGSSMSNVENWLIMKGHINM
ncbi:hypothetical protein HanPSC8_Chr17g0754281 [Helianthus annuus]|nr:hypothetical protein HanPSC8_Chr17g0754281 [Helianthus annuus]